MQNADWAVVFARLVTQGPCTKNPLLILDQKKQKRMVKNISKFPDNLLVCTLQSCRNTKQLKSLCG